jgi:HTH-type transcriptional regulator, competence development regulator
MVREWMALMATPTRFGKEVRKLRLESGETMADLARAIGKSAAFLSSVETGKKAVPRTLVEDLVRYYGLDEVSAEQLYSLAQVRQGIYRLSPRSENAASVVAALEKKMDSLNEDQTERILNILSED